MQTHEARESGSDRLIDDIKAVIAEVETLLHQAASSGTQQASLLREQASEALHDAGRRLRDAQEAASDNARAAARATDDWVRDHPWQTAGLAAGVAFLLGLLASRR